MNKLLIALAGYTKMRRDMIVFRRFRNSFFFNRTRMIRVYGQEYIDFLVNYYNKYSDRLLNEQIIQYNRDIADILESISINEALELINQKK